MIPDNFTDNTARHRYELVIDGYTAYATYRKEQDILYIDYVEAPQALRGMGAAGRLMQYIVQCATQEGLKIIPVCGYAAAWLRRYS